MGIINKFASAALVLSFCGTVSLSAFAQDGSNDFAVLKNNKNTKTTVTVFDKFDKIKEETAAPAPAKKQTFNNDNPWTGFYVGGYIGSNWTRSSADTSTSFSSTGYFANSSVNALNSVGPARMKSSGFSGGAQGGYNYQTGNFLIGVEADFGSNRSRQDSITNTAYPCCSPNTFTIANAVETNWMMTARPRVGVVYDKTLFYVTGGLALTDVSYAGVFSDSFTAVQGDFIDKTRVGWTGGGGIEHKFAKRWSAKAEYLFADFGRISDISSGLSTTTPAANYTQQFNRSLYLKNHNLRFGVNFHF